MGIFKNVTKLLKKAAPIIGGSIGFAIAPGFLGAALGSGIGSLVGGADPEDALKAAALGGIAGYAGSKFFGPAAGSSSGMVTGPEMAISPTDTTAVTAIQKAQAPASFFDKAVNFAKTPTGIATIGGLAGLGALATDEPETTTTKKERPFPEGKERLGMGLIDGKSYNLNNKEERDEYFRKVREKQGFFEDNVGIMNAAGGGEVEGPGTGTSDSVPARLSDGEFVLTAKAVRGAGGGDRDVGAARMYDMMSELERVA
jgi:hypothetical protein